MSGFTFVLVYIIAVMKYFVIFAQKCQSNYHWFEFNEFESVFVDVLMKNYI